MLRVTLHLPLIHCHPHPRTHWQAVKQGNKYFAEFSCAGDLTNPAGRAKHVETCKEKYVTGEDLWNPDEHAVSGKPVATVKRTLAPPTLTITTTDCGMDAEGAYCDEYEGARDSDDIPYDINCEYGYRNGPFELEGRKTGVWPVSWSACNAYDDSDWDTDDAQSAQAQLLYSQGGPQFYPTYAWRCEVGKGVYGVYRFRRGGSDITTPVKSFTTTYSCDTPYPIYRQEFNGAGTARLGALVLCVATALLLI